MYRFNALGIVILSHWVFAQQCAEAAGHGRTNLGGPAPRTRFRIWARRDMARILVIDDDVAVRDAMAFLLRAHGHDVQMAAEGVAGLEALSSAAIDLVIVDRHMPKLDGLEVIKSVRAKRPALPIIAISGSIMDEDFVLPRDLVIGAGFGAIKSLPKPLKAETLVSLVEEMLTVHGEAN